jgi:hypothetical protein
MKDVRCALSLGGDVVVRRREPDDRDGDDRHHEEELDGNAFPHATGRRQCPVDDNECKRARAYRDAEVPFARVEAVAEFCKAEDRIEHSRANRAGGDERRLEHVSRSLCGGCSFRCHWSMPAIAVGPRITSRVDARSSFPAVGVTEAGTSPTRVSSASVFSFLSRRGWS